MNWNRFELNINSFNFLAIFAFLVLGCSESDTLGDKTPLAVDMDVLQYNKWEMAKDILKQINIHRSELSIGEIEFNKMSATALAIEHCQYMIENETVSHANFSKRKSGIDRNRSR